MSKGFNKDFVKCPYCGKKLEGASTPIGISVGKTQEGMEGYAVNFGCKDCSATIITTVFKNTKG